MRSVSLTRTARNLESFARERNVKRVVVGVSGGLYSTAAAALCTRVFGVTNTICVTCPVRECDELKPVKEAMDCIGQSARIVDIGPMVAELAARCYYDDCRATLEAGRVRVSMIRADVLAYMAECVHGLVVNPINLDKWLVGDFVPDGDGRGDVAPFYDLHATEVLRLARHMGIDKGILQKIVDPDKNEELGFDCKDVEDLYENFMEDRYRGMTGDQVLFGSLSWPEQVRVLKKGEYVPQVLTTVERAVVKRHNSNLDKMRKRVAWSVSSVERHKKKDARDDENEE